MTNRASKKKSSQGYESQSTVESDRKPDKEKRMRNRKLWCFGNETARSKLLTSCIGTDGAAVGFRMLKNGFALIELVLSLGFSREAR